MNFGQRAGRAPQKEKDTGVGTCSACADSGFGYLQKAEGVNPR